MSLVSLTFGNGNHDPHNSPHMWLETPADRAQKKYGGKEGLVEVVKACRFVGAEEWVYIIAKVASGWIDNTMKGSLGEKTLEIVDFESRYGSGAKEGMQCGILLGGAELCDFQVGGTIKFSK